MSNVTKLHNAVKSGDVGAIKALLDSVSETDVRATYPLHMAAEFGQATAARVLLD